MRKRDSAYKKARRTGNSVDWRKAVFLRNRVEFVIKNYKRDKIRDNLNRNRNNPAAFWKDIRSIMPKAGVAEVSSLKDEDTGYVYSAKELTDHINSYFANIGEKLAGDIMKNTSITARACPYRFALNNKNDSVSGD